MVFVFAAVYVIFTKFWIAQCLPGSGKHNSTSSFCMSVPAFQCMFCRKFFFLFGKSSLYLVSVTGTVNLFDSLFKDVLFYCRHTYAAFTKNKYCSYFNAYHSFCILLGLPLFPGSTCSPCMYAKYLIRFMLSQFISLSISFIALLHKESDLYTLLLDG